MPAKLLKRLCALDTALRLSAGHGVAETIFTNMVEDIKGGDFGLILVGWSFEDLDETQALLTALAEQWSAEAKALVQHS